MWWKETKKLSDISSASRNQDDGTRYRFLNCFYRDTCLPSSRNEADVVPIPEHKPIQDINKHLLPISFTNIYTYNIYIYIYRLLI